jgi:hypothetical protein
MLILTVTGRDLQLTGLSCRYMQILQTVYNCQVGEVTVSAWTIHRVHPSCDAWTCSSFLCLVVECGDLKCWVELGGLTAAIRLSRELFYLVWPDRLGCLSSAI